MSDDTQKPRLSPDGARRADAREARLALALRQNLARRKAQQRARDAAPATDSQAPAPAATAGDREAEG